MFVKYIRDTLKVQWSYDNEQWMEADLDAMIHVYEQHKPIVRCKECKFRYYHYCHNKDGIASQ